MGSFEDILAELPVSAPSAPDPELQAVTVAITLEDALDIVLREDEIDPVHLGTPEAIATLLRRRHGPR